MLTYIRSFADEMHKLSGLAHTAKADNHFKQDIKNWEAFEKNLKAKSFQKAVINHPEADDKLKSYVENFGGYLNSKKVMGKVPSRTSGKLYTIKELPNGRLACDCKDWQYHHSVRDSDCDHIDELVPMLEKKSASVFNTIAKGVSIDRKFNRKMAIGRKGDLAQDNIRRLHTGQPLRAV